MCTIYITSAQLTVCRSHSNTALYRSCSAPYGTMQCRMLMGFTTCTDVDELPGSAFIHAPGALHIHVHAYIWPQTAITFADLEFEAPVGDALSGCSTSCRHRHSGTARPISQPPWPTPLHMLHKLNISGMFRMWSNFLLLHLTVVVTRCCLVQVMRRSYSLAELTAERTAASAVEEGPGSGCVLPYTDPDPDPCTHVWSAY